jgi:hypothetical protein
MTQMGQYAWYKVIDGVERKGMRVFRKLQGVKEMDARLQRRALARTATRCAVDLGVAFGLIAVTAGESWVTGSPLFRAVGSGACLLLLLVSCAAGGCWWAVTGNPGAFNWAKGLLPFCVEPYRSGAGLALCLVVAGLALARIPWGERLYGRQIVYVRYVLQCLVTVVWLVAVLRVMVYGYPSPVK